MEEENKNRFIIKFILSIIAVIIILLVVAVVVINIINDKSYEIEEVTNFSYFKLYENKKYGVIDTNGNVLVPPTYDMLEIPNPSKEVFIGYLNYSDNEDKDYQTEVVNSKNEKILTEYEQVLPLMFKDALAEVPYEKSVLTYKENGKYGIIDYLGKKITKAEYDSIESLLYKEGCLLVKQNGKYGIINIKGKQIIEAKYDSISADGYYDAETKYMKAGFIIGNKLDVGYRYGYIDNNGKIVLEPQYNEVERITEIGDDIYLLAYKNGQAGVYKNSDIIIKHGYEQIEYNKLNQWFILQKGDKQGITDLSGKEILKLEYDNIILITEQTITAQKDGTISYFDKKGIKQKVSNVQNYISIDSKNYIITLDENYQYGIKSKQGLTLLDNEYSYIEYLYGTYFITTKAGNTTVYDAQNKKEVISGYNVVQKIEGKNALQAIITENRTIDIYNENMEKTATMQHATLSNNNNYFKLTSETERKYFDKNGNEIQNTEIFPNLSLFAFKAENDKWGFKDKNGNVKIEAEFDMVTEINSYGFAGIKKENLWGIINSNGEIIVSPSYKLEINEPEFIGKYCKINFGYGMAYYTKDLQD